MGSYPAQQCIMPRENGMKYFVAGMDFTQGAGDFPTRMVLACQVA